MFLSPYLAGCADRTLMPKIHPKSGGPEHWFSDASLAHHHYFGLSFDFFVNWSLNPCEITPVVWIKVILSPEFNYADVADNLTEVMTSHFGESYLTLLDSFKNQNSFTVQFIVFRDDADWTNESSELLIATFTGRSDKEFIFDSEMVPINAFKEIIQKHSGGPIEIGSKKLIYGTSKLECYLSKTDSLYPGDVDLIVFNERFEPIALLEYKKHNLQNSISEQNLSNYYPNPDARKYNRLAILRDHLGKIHPNLPIFNVYYPTNPDFSEGRLELLKGTVGNLETSLGSDFLLPKSLTHEEFDGILNKLQKAISYHKSLF